MSSVSIVALLELNNWPAIYARIILYYLDDADNQVGTQTVGINSFTEDAQNVYINTQPFTPDVPENAVKFRIGLQLLANNNNWYEVLNLGVFDVNILKQETPPFMLRITISSATTQ